MLLTEIELHLAETPKSEMMIFINLLFEWRRYFIPSGSLIISNPSCIKNV